MHHEFSAPGQLLDAAILILVRSAQLCVGIAVFMPSATTAAFSWPRERR